MSSEITPQHDLPVVLQEATSKNGNKYQASITKKPGFAVDVNWPPSKEWVNLAPDLANKIYITRYKLVKNPPPSPGQTGPFWEWTLWFTNTATYDFFFEDKTHDEYNNDTYLKRDHAVSYDSEDPTIIRVRGV
ncbi:hypothetical protein FHL15_003293 [Xylaria flabelliformis]|uniref:Uncharacterized protein n=1 Tax=Xylaria flabelliformis TaxID=2512241 RepID=A0A553I6B0_9PEZI|nr:hypothetical protein FHL15_003293 [Xylaria flabelliformis]